MTNYHIHQFHLHSVGLSEIEVQPVQDQPQILSRKCGAFQKWSFATYFHKTFAAANNLNPVQARRVPT